MNHSNPIIPAGLLLFTAASLHAGVLAHYSFDEDFSDSSGNARHGTLEDLGVAGDSGIIKTAGDYRFGGGAMRFGGGGDRISIPSHTFSTPAPYTIAFWARQAPASHDWDMVAGDASNNFFIALGAGSNSVGMRWRSANNTSARQADFSIPRDSQWRHYAIVASGTNVSLYRDGVLDATATGKTIGFIIDSIGHAYSGTEYSFQGEMDEFWVFDEALDAAAIAGLHAANDPGLPSHPEPGEDGFHFRFDGDLSDSGDNGVTATAQGGAARTTSTRPARAAEPWNSMAPMAVT